MPSLLLPLIVVDRLDAHARRQEAERAEADAAGKKKKGRPPTPPPEGWEYLVIAALEGGPDALDAELNADHPRPRRAPAPEPTADKKVWKSRHRCRRSGS